MTIMAELEKISVILQDDDLSNNFDECFFVLLELRQKEKNGLNFNFLFDEIIITLKTVKTNNNRLKKNALISLMERAIPFLEEAMLLPKNINKNEFVSLLNELRAIQEKSLFSDNYLFFKKTGDQILFYKIKRKYRACFQQGLLNLSSNENKTLAFSRLSQTLKDLSVECKGDEYSEIWKIAYAFVGLFKNGQMRFSYAHQMILSRIEQVMNFLINEEYGHELEQLTCSLVNNMFFYMGLSANKNEENRFLFEKYDLENAHQEGLIFLCDEIKKKSNQDVPAQFQSAMMNVLKVEINEICYAFPVSDIRGVIKLNLLSGEYISDKKEKKFIYENKAYKIMDFSLLLNGLEYQRSRAGEELFLCYELLEENFVIDIDKILGNYSVEIISLGNNLPQLPGVFGATIFPDGQLSLVIDLLSLLKKERKLKSGFHETLTEKVIENSTSNLFEKLGEHYAG